MGSEISALNQRSYPRNISGQTANKTINMNYINKKRIITLLTSVIVITGIAASVLLMRDKDAPTVAAGWWNDNWSYRTQIVINSDYVTGDLTDFPVLISFTDENVGTKAQSDGDDIIFINRCHGA